MLTPVPMMATSSPRRAESVSRAIEAAPDAKPELSGVEGVLPGVLASERERFISTYFHKEPVFHKV